MISLLIGTAQAATADPAAQGSAFPPFESSTFAGQIFWLAIAFGLLYYLMSKIALPRVADTLQTRAARIDGDLSTAAKLQAKAAAAGEAYEKLLADAKSNAQAIGQKAKDEAAKDAETRRKAVEADSAQKIAAAEASISAARAAAMTNVGAIASDAAADIVARISGVPAKADDLAGAVRSALT